MSKKIGDTVNSVNNAVINIACSFERAFGVRSMRKETWAKEL
jgi:hypothetical protein